MGHCLGGEYAIGIYRFIQECCRTNDRVVIQREYNTDT